ncbi:hypothetical protein KQ940_12025 [Marinobacterium sp. D7]|uniref:hypothetical protein n=1 Tax=Marinobacterium ramblicola TaxID=2849041 RepID=UPI001C2DC077|nr:hypothetical protein [Marinobacterium ramblicola]MBV1788783.1 hypothetical protein [Marinobacterium ramblicola]
MNSLFGSHRPACRLLIPVVCTLMLAACAQKPQPQPVVKKPEPKPAPPPPSLVIRNMHPAAPEKHGVVAAHIDFVNGTPNTLEYVMFKTTAYTADGKLVRAKKTGRENAWLRVAGPFAPGESSGDKRWDKVWQNSKLSCFRIEGAELIDVNGVVEYFEADRIKLMPELASKGDCDGNS